MRGPNVDLIHDPRWGRTEESFGEDPYLVGEMAKGYLAGLHGDDPKYLLGACTLKHFAANSNETTRLTQLVEPRRPQPARVLPGHVPHRRASRAAPTAS